MKPSISSVINDDKTVLSLGINMGFSAQLVDRLALGSALPELLVAMKDAFYKCISRQWRGGS